MFGNEIYGFTKKEKMIGMGKPEMETGEEKDIDLSMEEINDMMNGMGLVRVGNGLKRSGGGLKRSGGGLKRSGGGLKRSGDGLKRSGEGLIQTGGGYETIGINQIGGECDVCPMEKTERPKIGQELRDLMIKQFCK